MMGVVVMKRMVERRMRERVRMRMKMVGGGLGDVGLGKNGGHCWVTAVELTAELAMGGGGIATRRLDGHDGGG